MPALASPTVVGAIEYRTDHVLRAIGTLITQYRDKANVVSLLTAFANQIQKLEDGVFPLLTQRFPAFASGAQLDLVGRVVGEPRNGRVDDTYRFWIQARILINTSGGTVEEMYSLLKLILDTNGYVGYQLQISEAFPKAIQVYVKSVNIDEFLGAELAGLLRSVKDAGANLGLTVGTTPYFGFDGAGSGFETGYFARTF